MVVASGFLAHALSLAPKHASVVILIAAIYLIPYLIAPPYSPSPVEAAKQTTGRKVNPFGKEEIVIVNPYGLKIY